MLTNINNLRSISFEFVIVQFYRQISRTQRINLYEILIEDTLVPTAFNFFFHFIKKV